MGKNLTIDQLGDRLAEEALLSACLVNSEIHASVKDRLCAEDFYYEDLGQLFRVVVEQGKTLTTEIADALKIRDTDSLVSFGIEYIAELKKGISVGWERWVDKIKDLSIRRQIDNLALSTRDAIRDESLGIDEITTDTKRRITEVIAEIGIDEVNPDQEVKDIAKEIFKRKYSRDKFVGVLTGMKNIDDKVFGFEPGVHIIAARPSVGKSALALNIADNMSAINNDGRVIIFSYEMTKEQLYQRRVAMHSGIPYIEVITGRFENDEPIQYALEEIKKRPLWIYGPKYRYIDKAVAKVDAESQKHKIKAVIFDYIQLMDTKSAYRNSSRHFAISDIARKIQTMAISFNIPVFLLSQLNRNPEHRNDKIPVLSDLKESGDLEQVADSVLMLYRENLESRVLMVKCCKGRNRGTFLTFLKFNQDTQKIKDADEEAFKDFYDQITGKDAPPLDEV